MMSGEQQENDENMDASPLAIEELEEPVITDTVRFPKNLPPQVIAALQAEQLDALQEKDRVLVEKGMHLFFSNQFREAEALFAAHYCEDSLVASAYGTLGTIRALLSMEQCDVDEACQRLLFASNVALQVSPPERVVAKTISAVSNTVSSAFSKASGFLGRWSKGGGAASSSPEVLPVSETEAITASPLPPKTSASPGWTSKRILTASQFRAEVVHAESEVLRATLLLLQDSFSAYVKAGLALRRSYNTYARLEQYMLENEGASSRLDRNSVEGVHFGLGCIHVVTSILPPKILAILKVLGYMHNRDIGFQHLQRCLESATLRSPLASLFMLAFHGMLPSFALVMIPDSLPICQNVVAHNIREHPVSVIHLWITGRVARLSRDCKESMHVMEKCLANGKHLSEDLPQLQHFALYDQAMNWCMMKDWRSAASAYQNLENESNWSKKFFSYAQGCCYEMIALAMSLEEQVEGAAAELLSDAAAMRENGVSADHWWIKASDAYRRGQAYPATRLGGRVISIDQFVTRRLNTMMERQGASDSARGIRNVVPLPGLELLLIFYMLHQTPETILQSYTSVLRRIAVAMLERDTLVPKALCQELLAATSPVDTAVDGVDAALLKEGLLLPVYNGETVVMLLMLAECVRDGGLPHNEVGGSLLVADKIFSSLVDSNAFPRNGKSEEIKWCAPFASYERAICRYKQRMVHDDAAAACRTLQSELDTFRSTFGRSDYHFEMQMQFRLHLTNDFLRHQQTK
jgi:hypothetical protein